jgi:hypothetical protein
VNGLEGDTSDPVAVETAKVVEVLEEQVRRDYAPPQVKRDAHPKMHGCVQAEVTVCPEIHDDFRHGVFNTPGKSYWAWIRFSNAFRIQHDLEFETRGMGIKLLDVPGEKLSGDELSTQDFLLATWDAFFLPNETDYAEFAKAVGEDPPKAVRFFRERRLWRAYYQMLRSALVLARNPLAIQYFSQTPYKLGPTTVVKLQARPCLTPALVGSLPAAWVFWCQAIVANGKLILNQRREKSPAAEDWCDRYVAPRDLLRIAMMSFLAEHDASFDLLVQRWIDSPRMPINDATRRWPESLSRYEKVATIRIPRQVFWPQPSFPENLMRATKNMMELGENMSFNPWHTLPDHEPLGAINLMRRVVYPAIVNLRHGLNRVAPIEPTTDQYKELKQIVQ